MSRLRILRSSFFGPDLPLQDPSGQDESIPFQTVKDWIIDRTILRRFFSYSEVELFTYRIEYIPKPFLAALLVRLLSRGKCWFSDETGARQRVTFGVLLKYLSGYLRDVVATPSLLRKVAATCDRLEKAPDLKDKVLDLSLPPLYLRTDLWFGVKSGGSVGHIAGVLNHLDRFAGKPIFMTTDPIPTVRPELESHVIVPDSRFCGFSELPSLYFNGLFTREAERLAAGRPFSFVYQRYSLNNLSGLELARRWGVPFVVEYNGSEVWIARNWGKSLQHEKEALRIEEMVLKGARVVVVVSQPMGDELVKRGVDPAKVLVNPNGVDPDKYSSEVDGSSVRSRLGLEGKKVIGFIGTFGRWHGAEVLAEAFGRLLERKPEFRKDVRLLMIGDGITMGEVRSALDKHAVRDLAVLTGLVPQAQGPAHLAACDLLVNSTVPNADGTPFFGSPTKLFEYMAMGKGIVASDLDQIGEVLRHGETAYLVKPGDVDALASGLEALLLDPSLADRMGRSARQEALDKYTWERHTGRILERLKRMSEKNG